MAAREGSARSFHEGKAARDSTVLSNRGETYGRAVCGVRRPAHSGKHSLDWSAGLCVILYTINVQSVKAKSGPGFSGKLGDKERGDGETGRLFTPKLGLRGGKGRTETESWI
jgi:hypothetical protein